jgi:hypothetical protein
MWTDPSQKAVYRALFNFVHDFYIEGSVIYSHFTRYKVTPCGVPGYLVYQTNPNILVNLA